MYENFLIKIDIDISKLSKAFMIKNYYKSIIKTSSSKTLDISMSGN